MSESMLQSLGEVNWEPNIVGLFPLQDLKGLFWVPQTFVGILTPKGPCSGPFLGEKLVSNPGYSGPDDDGDDDDDDDDDD